MNEFNMADTGGLRNEEPLTVEQKEHVLEYAILLGMPVDQIVFIDYGLTAYSGEYDVLKVGTDVLPRNERIRNPNSNISLKGTIAHELVGHREAHINGLTQTDDLLEEVQASIRAARFAPDLSKPERMDLLRDGICRLNKRGISLQSVKHKLHMGLQELWWKRCMDEQPSLWLKISGLLRYARNDGHCEERSDEAIQKSDH